MSNSFSFSYANPLTFVEVDPIQIPQYLFRHMDDYLLDNRLTQWESGKFLQPWMKVDTISLQAVCNAGQPEISIIDCLERSYLTFNMAQKQQNKYDPTQFIYESNTSLATLDPNVYWFLAKIGSIYMISNPIKVSEVSENTILLQYKHRAYKQGLIFETGFAPSLRVPGMVKLASTESKNTVYEDQVTDMTLIESSPYEVYNFYAGIGDELIPDWFRKKLNRIITMSDVLYDGKYFTVNGESAKWEEIASSGNGLLKGFSIEIRESIARNSKVVDFEQDQNRRMSVMYLVNTKGFGDKSNVDSSNVIHVYDFE